MTTEIFNANVIEYVTVMIGNQLFGLPISRVQDVFMPDRLTRVPLASPEIAGVLNLMRTTTWSALLPFIAASRLIEDDDLVVSPIFQRSHSDGLLPDLSNDGDPVTGR